uniref:Uncharacterized protein n=1 Tax=Pyricularia oryzae (strain 70-15 / ATCC MYA-4617 / FGSC 8958) TaxID=242507 RepID=Q2KFK6_PYRO7|nr:hypothetical protein MGCH7_ch7g679 [Pyricularia oryzae 70-15]
MSKPELLGVGSCLSSTCLEDRDKLDRIWSSSPNSQSPNSSPQPTSPHTAAAAAWARSTVVTSPALTPSPQRKGANDSTSLSQLHHRLRPLAAPPQEAITTTNNTAAAGSVIVFKQDQFDANRHATAPGTSFSSELAPAQSPPPPVSNSRATVISSPDLQLSPHEHPARLNCDENDSSATRPKLNPKSPDLDVAAVAPARNIGELNSNGLHTAPLSPVITGDKPGHLGDAAGNNDLALEGAATVAPNGRDRPEEEPERSEGDGQEATTDFADATWDEDGDDHFTLVTPQSIELKPAKGQVRIVTPRRGSANNMIFGHKQQAYQQEYPDENVGRQSSFVGLPLIRRTSTFSKSLSKSSDDFKGIAGVSPDPGPGPGARSEQELFSQIPIPPIPQDPEPGTSTQLSYTQTPIHMSKPIFPFTPVAPAGNFEVKSPVGQPGRYVEHGWQVDSPVEAKAPPGKSFGGVPQQQPKAQPPAPQPQTRKATVESGNTSPPVRNQTGFSPPIPTGNGKHLHTPPTGGPGWTLQETKPMEPLRAVRPRQSQLNMGDQYALDKETGASSRMSPLEPPKPIFDPNGITRTQTNESVESNGSLLGKLRSRFNHEKAMTMSANTAAGNAPSGGRLSVDQTRRNADNVSLAPSYDGTPGKKKNRGSWLGLRGEKKAGDQTELDGEASGEQLVSSPVKSTTFGRNGNGPQSAQAAQTGPQQPGGPAAGAPGRPSTSDARPNGMPVTAPQGGAAQPGQKQSLSNKLSGLLNTITDSKPPKQPQHQPPSSSHGLNPVMEEQSGNQNRFGQGLRPVTAGAPLSSGQQQSNMTGLNSGQTQPGQPQSGAPVQTELSNKQESMKPSQQPGAQPRIGLSAHPALVGTQGPATRQRSDTANSRPFTSASNMPAQQTSDAESMNLGLPPRTKTGGAPSIAESERSAKRVSSTSAFLSGLFGIKAGKGKESKSQAGQSQMTPLNQTGMGGSAPPNGPQPGQPVPIQLGRGMPVPGQPFLIQQQPGQPPIVVQPGPPGAPQPQHTQRMVLVPGPDGRLVMMPIPPGMEIQMRPRPGLPGQQPSMTLVPTLQPQQQVSHGAPGSSPPVPQGPPGQKPTQWPLGSDGSPQPNQSQQASTNATPAHSPPMAGANGSQWLASGAQGQVAPGSMAGNAQIQQQFQPVQQVPIRGQSPDHRTLPSQMLPPGASVDQSAALNQPFANAAATQHTERKPAGLHPHAQNPNDFGNTERAGTPPKSKHDRRRSSVSSAQHSPQLVPHGSPHVRRVSTPSLSLGQHGSPGFQPAGVSMQMGATAVPGTQSAQAPARTTTSPLPSPGLANQAKHHSTSPQASPGLVSQMGQLNLGQGPPQGIQMQGQAPGQMTPGQQPVQAQQPPQQQPQVLPEESPAIPWQTYNNQAPAQGGRRASNTSGALTEHQSSASRFFNKLANVGSGGPQQRQVQKADKKADKKMEKKAEKKKSGLGLFNMKSSKQEEPVAAQAQPVRLGPPPGGPQYGDKGPPTMYGQPINGLNGAAQQQPPPVGAPAHQSQVNQQPIVQGQQQGQQQLQAQGPQGAQAQGHKPMGQQSQLQPGAPTSQAQGSGIPNTAGFTQSPPLPGAPFYSPGAVPEPFQPKQNAATQPQSNEPTYAPVGIPAGYATVRSEGRMLQHGGSPYLISHGSFPDQYVGHPAFQSPQNTPPQQQQQQQWSNSSTPPLGQQQQQPQPQQYQQPGNYQMGAHGVGQPQQLVMQQPQPQHFNVQQGVPGQQGQQQYLGQTPPISGGNFVNMGNFVGSTPPTQGALQAVGQPGSGRPTPSQSPDPAQPQTTSPPLPHIMHPGSPHSYPLPESARATTFSPVNPAAGAMPNPPLPQRSQMGMIPEGAAQQQPQLHQQQSMQHLNDVELQRQNSMISQVSSVHPVGGFASANEVSRMTSGAGSSEGSSGGQTAGPVVSSAETSPVPEQHSKMASINSQQTNQRYAQGQFENIYDTSPRLQSNTHSSPPPMVTASPPPPMPVTSQAASPPPHAVYSPPVSQAVYPPIPQPVGPPVRSTDQQVQQQDQLRAQSASPPSQSSNAAPAAAAAAAVGPSVAVIHSHSPEPPSPTDEEIRKVGGTTTGHLTVDGGSEENGAGGSNGELGRKPTIRATSAEQYEEAKRKMLLRDLEEKIPVFIQDDPPPIKKEEEATVPKMSATSYPGQEWNPYGDGFETWED